MSIESVNPATGRLLQRFQPLSDDALRERIALAAQTCTPLRSTPIEHRALWMRKLASLLEQEAAELAVVVTEEMGKPLDSARLEALKCAAACRFYADHAARMLAPEPVTIEGSHSYVQWEPMGVVLAVMPWNFPLWQVIRFAAPALMAANVCLIKHAPNVSRSALALELLIRRAGFPRGSYQTLLIETQQVERVLADPRVAAVTLTGSESAGRAVAAQAGWLIKKSVLELGGSDPFIVRPSANLDRAVESAVASRCVNSGQSCIAAKRFLIATEIYDSFVPRFVASMQAMSVGDPMLRSTRIGPLATKRQVDTLESQVQLATHAGARLLTGGHRLPGAGFFFEPTVLADVPRSCAVYREEVFGPVAMLFRVHSLDETIAVANDTGFGLGASAWTRDPAEQQRLISELACGMVYLNQLVASDHRLPFGGVKSSGYGRELTSVGMREFMSSKTVVIATPPQQRSATPAKSQQPEKPKR